MWVAGAPRGGLEGRDDAADSRSSLGNPIIVYSPPIANWSMESPALTNDESAVAHKPIRAAASVRRVLTAATVEAVSVSNPSPYWETEREPGRFRFAGQQSGSSTARRRTLRESANIAFL
jgi:hypothetical protein